MIEQVTVDTTLQNHLGGFSLPTKGIDDANLAENFEVNYLDSVIWKNV
jgi:hypothetical protein